MVCLPFDLSSAQVRKYFEEVKALESVELVGEDCNLNFGNVRDMVAGVPYLVKVAQTVSVQTYEKVTIDADAVSSGATVVSDGAVTALSKRWYPTEIMYMLMNRTYFQKPKRERKLKLSGAIWSWREFSRSV